jgi:NAD(P)-dependent dehydrogenase (short-subunit alcohol dehydrogenase family)
MQSELQNSRRFVSCRRETYMAGNWFDLTGRVALVTGAGKGLGRAIAGALAHAGADVAVASRTRPDLERAVDDLAATGRRIQPVVADVSKEESVRSMVKDVLQHFGHIDILVNNAGVEGEGPVTEMDTERWDHVMNINARGPMLCCKHVGPHMIERRSGKVINVASVLASRVARSMALYSASKAALVQLTRTLALEWIQYDIQVNALCPGYFLTPMNEEFFKTEAGNRLIAKLPIRRLGQVHELEGAAVFLASDATSYVTGTTLYVDGGHSLA